ncbi:MAG: hypothetical protein ACI9XC_000311 [Gammaproteobacteria bacterium]|jgi:hypothetical protein
MEINLTFFSITLNTPMMFFVILPVAVLILFQFYKSSGTDQIKFSGLEYAIDGGLNLAENKRNFRLYWLLTLVLFVGFAWTAPELRTNRPLWFGPADELEPVMLVAMDVSGSMTEPLGGYVVDGELNLEGITRFDASQTEIFELVANFTNANLGLILFSVQPMLVRWPTSQTEFDFHEVLDEGLRFTNPGRKRTSQLAQFAGGTATRAGLAMARDTLVNQKASSRALILIGDLIDNIDEVIEGVQKINDEDVFVYVVALDAQPESLVVFTSTFENMSNVYLYTANSIAELSESFSQIESIENERRIQKGSLNYLQDIRWLVCLIGFVLGMVMIVLFETRFHKTHR